MKTILREIAGDVSESRNFRLACLVLAIFLMVVCDSGAASVDQGVKTCISSIERVKSYDITYRMDVLQYPEFSNLEDPNNIPIVAISETNRDVFAFGLGRRIERSIGSYEAHSIAVIDWKTATETSRPLSEAIRNSLPGLTYGDYLDPIEGAFFLSDLLRDERSKISAIEESNSDSKLIGLRLNNPGVRGRIALWLDKSHGCMPVKIEWFDLTGSGNFVLRQRSEIQRFIEYDNQSWAPAKASSVQFASLGNAQTSPRAYSGKVIEIIPEQSSWNAVRDDSLFLAGNLPVVNYSRDGWKYDYSAAFLKAMKEADKIAPPRLLPAILLVVALLPGIIAIYFRFRKSRSALI